jgi:hypothetical protein
VVAALAGITLAGCDATGVDAPASTPGREQGPSTAASDVQPTAGGVPQSYDSQSFVPALTVDRPSWLPADPVLDEPHFLTWVGEGVDVDRAVRFMSPIGVYDPRAPDKHPGELRPVPADYTRYLLGMRKYGVELSDRASGEVDGRRATLLTAGTTASLSGVLGCQDEGLSPDDCYGLQPYAVIRLAVIDDEGTTVLAWVRTLPGSPTRDQDFAAFEDLLATVHFR